MHSRAETNKNSQSRFVMKVLKPKVYLVVTMSSLDDFMDEAR